MAHHRAGRLVEAETLYRRVLEARPDDPDALQLLGALARDSGRPDLAVELIGSALARAPDVPSLHVNLANALRDRGDLDAAVAGYRRALALDPDSPVVHNNLGAVLRAQGKLDEAVASLERALALLPDHPEAHSNLGNALMHQGKRDAAMASFRRALALKPDHAEAHLGLAFPLLLVGDYGQGWAEYEWRWQCSSLPIERRPFTQPRWNGEPLAGRTILIHAEQGLGDTIQFARYVPLVAARGGRVVLECQPALVRLFQTVSGATQVIAKGDPLPPFDLHAPLMSLPHILGTTLAGIPADLPYLHPDATLLPFWSARIRAHTNALRPDDPQRSPTRPLAVPSSRPLAAGLVWSGNPDNPNNRNRSLPLAVLAPLARVPGVTFFSLQKGPAAAEAATPPDGMALVDLDPLLTDFVETAAAVRQLDLVITVDTSVAHLAGALGRPVWLLLACAADWRWLLDRDDSPWYPTVRLFRQSQPGDWNGLVARVAAELTTETRRHRDTSENSVSPCLRGEPSLAACLIVRDAEDCLARCLESVAPWVDEIVVVDTGSTDRTVAIARERGARVGYFPWCDDFAAARNTALELATADWVLSLDADEVLDPQTGPALRAVVVEAALQRDLCAYEVLVRNWEPGLERYNAGYGARLFPRHPRVRWLRPIHEVPRHLDGDTLLRFTRTDHLAIDHYGYADPDVIVRKAERNAALLQRLLQQEPDEPLNAFYLGRELCILQRWEEAWPWLDRCLQVFDAELTAAGSIAEQVHSVSAQCLLHLARPRLAAGRPDGARACVERLVGLVAQYPAVLPYRLSLADLLLETGNATSAAEVLAAGLPDDPQPDHAPLFERLGAALTRLERHDDARQALQIASSLRGTSGSPPLP
ncbi:MAG: tetratricopeptide repeat protein [Chloroflexi bacterium]|nr:tetratricopeptide repeat protein [Chloroflexota bacterium]